MEHSVLCLSVLLSAVYLASCRVLPGTVESDLPSVEHHAEVARVKRQANPMAAMISATFTAGDVNGDHGLDEKEYWNTFNTFDADGNHEITLGEYVTYFHTRQLPGVTPRIASELFFAGDLNHDGVLSEDDATIIFSNMDKNPRDHLVSEDEYFSRWQEVLMRIQG